MLLIINGGSSSIKFALFSQAGQSEKISSGRIDNIGRPDSSFKFLQANSKHPDIIPLTTIHDYPSAVNYLLQWIDRQIDMEKIIAIAHRIVHGMQHTAPTVITPALINTLKQIIPFDPDHLPNEINLMEILLQRHPDKIHIACFDTAFHQTMPRVARLLPIPRRFEKQGILRYGFHGLPVQWIVIILLKLL